jgi:hypothetical protein
MNSFQWVVLALGLTLVSNAQEQVEVGGKVWGPPPRGAAATSARVNICAPHNPPRGCDPQNDSDSFASKVVDRFTAAYEFLALRTGTYELVAVDNSGQYLPGCKTVVVPRQTKVDIELQEPDQAKPFKSVLHDEKGHVLAFRRVRVVPRCFDWENRAGFVLTDAQGRFEIPALVLAKDRQSVIEIDKTDQSSGPRADRYTTPLLVNVAFRSTETSQQEATAPAEGQSGVIQGQSVIGKPQSIPLLPPNEEITPHAWTVNLATGTVSPDVGLTVSEKFGFHLRRLYDGSSLFLPGVVAAIQQARDAPSEWPEGASGLGRRYASAYGYSVAVRNILSFGIDAPLRLDPRYFPSERRGPWPRLKHAFAQTLVTQKDNGGRTVNYWRVGSAYGAGFVSNLWYPVLHATDGDAALRGTTALGLDTAGNVIREFTPDMLRVTKHVFGRKQPRLAGQN